ncbi:MAG: crotonase/enoyl-CoA hydratase family protein [Rhodospirillales bacterium]|nr:crotonase/enoyl-CoA hydratase family protein [Rhodospirillales bacterium]
MGSFLLYDQAGPIVTLTMNQPETRNPLTGNSAVEEFVGACRKISEDGSVRAVILTGAGSAFSSGGNVKDMRRHYGPDSHDGTAIREEYRHGIQRLTLALYNLDVPTIAAVNGPAIGAGCDLTCMCDIRIASDRALFAESFVKVGIVPGDGGAWLLPRVVGFSKAAEMAFTGDPLTAPEALAAGLVSKVVAPEMLMEEARRIAGRIAANPGRALRLTKRLMRESHNARLETVLELSAAYQALAHKTPGHKEAVEAFIEKRPPNFTD